MRVICCLFPSGQSIRHVGVFLGTQEFFSHGQLYVALSRVTNHRNLKVYKSPEDKTAGSEATMMNVVFKEVLTCKCPKCSLPQKSSRYWYLVIDSGFLFILLISFTRGNFLWDSNVATFKLKKVWIKTGNWPVQSKSQGTLFIAKSWEKLDLISSQKIVLNAYFTRTSIPKLTKMKPVAILLIYYST